MKEWCFMKKYKDKIVYSLIYLIDIILVIYCAMQNKVHYVRLMSKDIFVGRTKDLFFGRNYVNLVIICFCYFYLVIMNKDFLKKKNSRMFMIISLIILLVINFSLFYIFTKRIY